MYTYNPESMVYWVCIGVKMSMELKVIRTLKKSHEDSRMEPDTARRMQISDDILDIIYEKVVTRHTPHRIEGKGIRALIEDPDE